MAIRRGQIAPAQRGGILVGRIDSAARERRRLQNQMRHLSLLDETTSLNRANYSTDEEYEQSLATFRERQAEIRRRNEEAARLREEQRLRQEEARLERIRIQAEEEQRRREERQREEQRRRELLATYYAEYNDQFVGRPIPTSQERYARYCFLRDELLSGHYHDPFSYHGRARNDIENDSDHPIISHIRALARDTLGACYARMPEADISQIHEYVKANYSAEVSLEEVQQAVTDIIERAKEATNCIICLDDDEPLNLISPCTQCHSTVFHASCFSNCLEKMPNCPTCRERYNIARPIQARPHLW